MGQMEPLQASNALQAWGNRGHGRAIFASGSHRQLLNNFQQLGQNPSSEGYHAQRLISAVNSLLASASPLNSMLKPKTTIHRPGNCRLRANNRYFG